MELNSQSETKSLHGHGWPNSQCYLLAMKNTCQIKLYQKQSKNLLKYKLKVHLSKLQIAHCCVFEQSGQVLSKEIATLIQIPSRLINCPATLTGQSPNISQLHPEEHMERLKRWFQPYLNEINPGSTIDLQVPPNMPKKHSCCFGPWGDQQQNMQRQQ